MEILTLLKANIRHKKGSFFSIIILMLIVSMSFTAVFSLKDNCENSIKNAQEIVNLADISMLGPKTVLNDELIDSAEKHSSVKKVVTTEAVASLGTEFENEKITFSWYLLELTDEYHILNEDLSDYAEVTPELKKGEIYIPQGTGTKLGCEVGDTLKITTIGGVEEFTIKGFVVDPLLGCMNIEGVKQVFISDEDYARLQKDATEMSSPEFSVNHRVVQVYKADENISVNEFKRQLNEDTGIVDHADFSFTKYQAFYYTNIFPDIILKSLLIFVVFLVAIVLIVMAHSISTSIEMEYTSLGIMKAQGFTESKIKMIFGAQYIFAEVIGSIIGVALAFPLIKLFGGIFQPILSIPCANNVSIIVSVLFVVAVLVLSAIFILIITRKVGKISPMKAISGGKEDVYFGSRLNAPVSKKALSSSLALRQFTSNKRRYIGTIIIVSILVFFMITMSVLGVSMDSKSSMESMGLPVIELYISTDESLSEKTVNDIENIIEKYTEIDNKYFYTLSYMTLNGDEYACLVYENPENIVMSDGRYPQYDNEIAVTDFLAKEQNLKIGDKVIVSCKDHEAEYVITGINVYATNSGLTFAMPFEGAQKLGTEDILNYGFSLADSSECVALAEEINEKYSNTLTAVGNVEDPTFAMYSVARNAMTAIIYVVSVIFSLVVVMMFCKKAFLQERKDIGIYKSLGFTSGKLRLQFAVRFLLVSLIGSVVGSILSLMFTQSLLTTVFKFVGISSFNTQFTAVSFIIAIAIVAVSFFVFSYLASRKIKTVEIKELVIE